MALNTKNAVPVLDPKKVNPGVLSAAKTMSISPSSGQLGTKAKAPEQNIKPPSNSISSSQSIKAPAAVDYRLQLQPGETPDAYKKRVGTIQTSERASTRSTTNIKPPTPQKPLYAQLIEDLQKRASGADKAVNKATADLTAFRQGTSQKIADIKSQAIPLEFQQGRAQVVQQASAEKEAALAKGVENLMTARGQDITALSNAAGYAQPIQVPYSNQVLDPTTGLPLNGGGSGSLNDAVALQVAKLKSNTTGYDQAVAALSAYGQQGLNSLQQQLGPGFNIQQSNARAAAQSANTLQTGTIGGPLQKASESANQALDSLSRAYSQLPGLAQTNIPLINQITSNLALQSGLGRTAVSSYVGALNEARAQLRSVLGSSGVNDLAAGGIVDSLLPDNMVPSEIPAKIAAAKAYIQNRVNAYGGQDFNNTSAAPVSSGGGLWDW